MSVNGKNEQCEIVSTLVRNCTHGRRILVNKTKCGTYELQMEKPHEDRKVIVHKIHLSRESLSVLMQSIIAFFEEEGESIESFTTVGNRLEFQYYRDGIEVGEANVETDKNNR